MADMYSMSDLQAIVYQLQAGKIGVLPTDTLYGLVAMALSEPAVEKVYEVRRRRPDKPCIILIADMDDLAKFDVTIDQPTNQLLGRLWPGAVSVVLPCNSAKLVYLHRGTKTLAFRLPDDEKLRELLRQTGPLIAPSANPEGQAAAITAGKAQVYFGDLVDFYVAAGPLDGRPSTLVAIENDKVRVLREGHTKIPKELL